MYKLNSVEIDGFWKNQKLSTNFKDNVNIFIGPNGSGKTTLINLLQAVLSVDLGLLQTSDFKEIRIKLSENNKTRSIVVSKSESDSVYDFVNIKISRESFKLPLIPNETELRRRFSPKYYETFKIVKTKMASIVQFSWLSVYRELIEEEDFEYPGYRTRRPMRLPNPIDARLLSLLNRLRDYHLKIQSEANELSTKFQKQVLISLLYSDQFDTYNFDSAPEVNFQELQEQLYNAYTALNVLTSGLRKKVDEHISIIKKSISTIAEKFKNQENLMVNDVLPLSLLKRTRRIVELSNDTDILKKGLFELLNLFLNTINDFFPDKNVKLNSKAEYGLEILKNNVPINFGQLSSGEKQLFILLAETVLQQGKNSVFIADEPELSLHVSWQKRLLRAIRVLNSDSQIIVATHSPEIAGAWRDHIIKMSEVLS